MGEVVAVSASYSFDRLFKGDAHLTVPDSQAVLEGLRFTCTHLAALITPGLNTGSNQ